MNAEPLLPGQQPSSPPPSKPQRVFLFEPGWNIARKVGYDRVFCYMMAPGQDYYHRLLDGEIYVYHGDERLCLACAERRGLLSYEPKGLREPLIDLGIEMDVDPAEFGSGFELKARP